MTTPGGPKVAVVFWGVEWHSKNYLDGETRNLIWDGDIRLFRTRRKCRAFIDERYGYIRTRPDLRREPHGWFVPRAVRVCIAPSDPPSPPETTSS